LAAAPAREGRLGAAEEARDAVYGRSGAGTAGGYAVANSWGGVEGRPARARPPLLFPRALSQAPAAGSPRRTSRLGCQSDGTTTRPRVTARSATSSTPPS